MLVNKFDGKIVDEPAGGCDSRGAKECRIVLLFDGNAVGNFGVA